MALLIRAFAHILVYFPNNEPSNGFQDWIEEERAERRSRNVSW